MSEKHTDMTPSLPGHPGTHGMFRSLQEEMDRMFQAFAMPQTSWRAGTPPAGGALGLRVDVSETDGEIAVTADLPGVPEDAVEVTLEDDVLRIRAEKRTEADRDEKNMRIVERSRGIFERAIRMPPGIDPERVTASFERGVLRVALPKPEGTPPPSRRIAIGKAS